MQVINMTLKFISFLPKWQRINLHHTNQLGHYLVAYARQRCTRLFAWHFSLIQVCKAKSILYLIISIYIYSAPHVIQPQYSNLLRTFFTKRGHSHLETTYKLSIPFIYHKLSVYLIWNYLFKNSWYSGLHCIQVVSFTLPGHVVKLQSWHPIFPVIELGLYLHNVSQLVSTYDFVCIRNMTVFVGSYLSYISPLGDLYTWFELDFCGFLW